MNRELVLKLQVAALIGHGAVIEGDPSCARMMYEYLTNQLENISEMELDVDFPDLDHYMDEIRKDLGLEVPDDTDK